MAFLQTAVQAAHHFQASYKPNTAVTDWIERLCTSSYKVTEYEGIPELVDAINLQATGPSEAARMLRKKLKYGNTHMQLRAIFIVKCLVENCGERTNFQRNFPDPTFVERMKILAGDPQTDPTVKKHLMSTLKGFHQQFKDDRSMKVYAQWWDEIGGARGEEDERARIAYAKERERLDKEQQLRLDEKMAARLQGEEDQHAAQLREKRKKLKELQEAEARAKEQAEKMRGEERARADAREEERKEYERKKAEKKKHSFWSMGDTPTTTGTGQKPAAKRAPFNFEAEKPKISQAVATASMYANGLVNALQRVNREQESVASNVQVQDQLLKLKETRKLIVRYIHLCEVDKEGEYIGMLISSNDQIIAALRLYDRMLTKPAEEDSDDDETVQETRAAAQNTMAADAAAATSGVPARNQEEADKMAANLAKVKLNNMSMQSFGELDKLRDRQRTEIYRNNQSRAAQGLPTPGIYSDLQGINFGQNLPQPMDPKHAVETRDNYDQGSLSEYSDYTSSDEENDTRGASTSAGGNRAWKDFVQEEEANRGSLLDDDPFGDSAEAPDTPSAYDRPRAHVWAEI